ncbi:MAG: hypothetical protein A2X32_08170 [Elusimicrobia bacterium GWC2_64_44]|nr:MAG: hypothetical protein A2X32_08170 [Elusimicrobia bacterium GWC2_64_44]
MRRAFSTALCAAADRDPGVVFLTGDLGYQVFTDLEKKHPTRYVNVGIAEAQMVNMAAGLAKEGFRPIAYSIASFMTARPFEQIRVCAAYPGLPVLFVGAGGGYAYASSGVTHHAGDDLALMSLLPGMTVAAPCDPAELIALLPQLLELPGPAYMRIGKFGEPAVAGAEPAVLGRARLMTAGEKVAVLTCGEQAYAAQEALKELAAAGVRPQHYHFHTVKPLDTAALARIAAAAKTMIVVEESSPNGGLGAGVAAWLAAAGAGTKYVRLGPPDEFFFGGPARETVTERHGYGKKAIIEACRKAWVG